MKRASLASLVLVILAMVACLSVFAQESTSTLVPPTLVPTNVPDSGDMLITESAVARIQRDGVVRVGILYNAAPFGELNIRGEVSGFDADLARKMAEVWGVEIAFVQVTRQTAIEALQMGGEVDMLVAAQVHRRELDSLVEFSQTYYSGSESIMVRADDGAASPADMANRRVGVVIGTASQTALGEWMQRTGIPVTVQTYFTLDQAYAALLMNEVDGIVGNGIDLLRITTQPELVRILGEAVAPAPYAIAVRRQDVNMRDLVNHTLQYLAKNGHLKEIHQLHMEGITFPPDTVPLWANIGEDAPTPAQYASDIAYPAQYALPRVLGNHVVRVAGVSTLPEDAQESQRRFELLNRSLIEQMAARWGATVEYLPDSAGNALDLVANGQADIAVGVQPDWQWADRVDFTNPYLLHGQRLMVKTGSNIQSFMDLRGGKWVAISTNEPEMEDRAVELATSVNSRIQVYFTPENSIAFAMLIDGNADVAFGDSLKLIPHVQANPADLQLTQREQVDSWYSRVYVAFAVPRNDLDFRLLVEYSLQELVRSSDLDTLLQPVILPDEIPSFVVWPGSSDYMGLALGG